MTSLSTDNSSDDGFYPPFAAAMDQLSQLVHLGWAGLGAGFVFGGVINAGRAEKLQEPEPNAARFERFAKEQTSVGFQVLYEVVTVRLVSILDAMVRRFVTRRLRRGSPVLLLPDLVKLEGPLVEFAVASEGEQAIILFELLREASKSSFRRGVERFEVLLNKIGYGGLVEPDVRCTLLELIETRNVIVHRMGIADAHFVDRCPWLNLKSGDPVPVRQHNFIRYFQACHWYAVELSLRALRTGENEIAGTIEEHEAVRASMLSGLRRGTAPPTSPAAENV